MAKLYASMSNEKDEKMDKVVSKILKGTAMGKGMQEEEKEECKYQIFDSCVIDLCYAAKEMYCEDDKSLDEVLEALIQGFKKLKGKEEELKKACEEQEEEDED